MVGVLKIVDQIVVEQPSRPAALTEGTVPVGGGAGVHDRKKQRDLFLKELTVKLIIVGEKNSVREDLHDFITRRLHFALGRFAPEIERVTTRVRDVNGPRGGVDQHCRMEVKLRGLENVMSEARADDAEVAVAFAAEGLGRGVARALERRRHTKRRPGVSMAGPRETAENGRRPKN